MNPTNKMRAIALDKFGGLETLRQRLIPVPEIAANEILIRVETAGVGEWDPFEREGGYAEMTGMEPKFPYILGSEGSGTVVAVGDEVEKFKPGDRVYAPLFLNPKGGFYAEYAAVDAEFAAPVPENLTMIEAGTMSGVGITALRGLEDNLKLKPDESILIFGASGGIGHVAVQLAKLMGARVFAVASGEDGVEMVKNLGIDAVVDGHKDDVLAAAQAFAPDGFDAALLTAGGETAEQAIQAVRDGGRVAYPNGIEPEPKERSGIRLLCYNGEPDPDIISRFHHLIEDAPFTVHVARLFSLEKAADAQRALDKHYLGKLALRV